MAEKAIDVYMLQETHLAGDFTSILPKGQLMIHHGPESQPTHGAKGGVAIILSPEMTENWKRGGSIIRRGGLLAGETTRLLGIDVEIKTVVRAKTKSKFKHLNLSLMTSYHPTSSYPKKDAVTFNQQVSKVLDQVPEKNILILGADLNASIGTHPPNTSSSDECDPSVCLLGLHGNPQRNARGDLIIGVINQHQLRAASTFFESHKHDTWIHPATKEKYQLDHFLIKRNHLQFVTNVKCKSDGIPSDHSALKINLRFLNSKWLPHKHRNKIAERKMKIDNAILRASRNKAFKEKIVDFINSIREENEDNATPSDLTPTETLSMFEDFVVKTAKETAESEVKTRPDWFTQSEQTLLKHIKLRNHAHKNYTNLANNENHQKLRQARANLQRVKRKAKRTWQNYLAAKCQRENFKDDPKAAWDIIFEIIEGFNAHHHKYNPKNFANARGKIAMSKPENAEILKKHFHEVFNRSTMIDETIIDEILQRPTANHLDNAPSVIEVKAAVKKMKNNKSPGISGATTDMFKNLPEEGYDLLTSFIQQFWENNECDFNQWHLTKLTMLYKGKGNTHDPNNWRGICLKETSSKIVSAILAKCLLSNLNSTKANVNQFGHIGCQEALHALRSALILRRQHGLETFVLFVDLAKAFDTVNHTLLLRILAKYGIPTKMTQAIEKLYLTCSVQLKLGETMCEIEYSTGVQQGDNMAPVLFLYVMQAAIETLRTKLTCNKPSLSYFPTQPNAAKQIFGRLNLQPKPNTTKKNQSSFQIDNLLYIDDGAFLFESLDDLKSATQTIHDHFSKFGLQMHSGTKNQKSKTEAMYIPASLMAASCKSTLPLEFKINGEVNTIHFANKFKYLGSIITPCLTEDAEIESRIKKAKSQMGILQHFFSCKDVSQCVKYWIYLSGPLNMLLWGTESWNISEHNRDKLRAFHHSAIRRILGIWMDEVMECRITNEQVRKWFENIPPIDDFIARRTWNYLGKVLRGKSETIPKMMLGAWVSAPRKAGRPQSNLKDNFIQTLKVILKGQISDEANFKEWFPIATNEDHWNLLLEEHFKEFYETGDTGIEYAPYDRYATSFTEPTYAENTHSQYSDPPSPKSIPSPTERDHVTEAAHGTPYNNNTIPKNPAA